MVSNIFILDQHLKTKLILSINGSNTFFKDLYDLDLSTGSESYEFSTTAEDIEESDYVMFLYKGDYKLFQIMDIEQEHSEGKIITSVYAESACLELLNDVITPMTGPVSMNAVQFMNYVLEGSEWELKKYSSSLGRKQLDINIDKSRQRWTTIQDYMKDYGYEITTRVIYENGHVKKKYIDMYAEGELGNKTYKRFEYSRNVKGITKKKDLYDFCTALILDTKQNMIDIQYGEVSGNTLKPKDGFFKSPKSDRLLATDNNKIYNLGKPYIYGVYEDNNSNSASEALEKAVAELKVRSVPKFDYECDTALTYKEYEDISIGDTVYVIDHTFNPVITLEARVGKLEISFTDRDNCKCTLSNYKEIKGRAGTSLDDIKELLDRTTIQYGDKDKEQEEITIKDALLDLEGRMLKNPTKDRIVFIDDQEIPISSIGPHDEYDDRVSTWIGENGHDIALGTANDDGETAHMPIVICSGDEPYVEYEGNRYYAGLNLDSPNTLGAITITGERPMEYNDTLEEYEGWYGQITPIHCGDSESILTSAYYGMTNDGPDNGILIEGSRGIYIGTDVGPPFISIFDLYGMDIDVAQKVMDEMLGLGSMRNIVLNGVNVIISPELTSTRIGTVAIKGVDVGDGSDPEWWAKRARLEDCILDTDLDADGYIITNIGDGTKSVSAQSEYTTSLINSGTNENIMHINMSYDLGEIRWCWKETVFTYPESDVDPETDEWVYTGRHICYIELPIFMAENIQNDYHINVSKMSWGDYRIVEKTPYYFILESQEEDFAFTFEIVAKLNDNQTLDNNTIIASTSYKQPYYSDRDIEAEEIMMGNYNETSKVNKGSRAWKI